MEEADQRWETWKWSSDPNGSFSVKQVRAEIEEASRDDSPEPVSFDWNPWAPPKTNYLLWRALLGKIASKMGLIHRGVQLPDTRCPRCGIYDEDPSHIFVNCLWAKSIWWNILSWLRVSFPLNITNLSDLIGYIKDRSGAALWKKTVYTVILATVWRIWLARNDKVFEDNFIPIAKLVDQIKEDAYLWICNRSKLKKPKWENWVAFDILDML
ncbi:uncharacterized protein LOC110933975 [Helianthus annuus]|uniref:uncharacterized protein LOC110933975 n=1 Tax=Helianthus annuus TaxID=4232 RepID=UPI000B908C1E|nr:uncharacterized protein LOC110933975 [Helianthus annuus]